MEISPKEIRRFLKELKPSIRDSSVPIFNMIYISSAGLYGVAACVDINKKTGAYYVKSTDFKCTGTPEKFTILPRILRDLAKGGVTDKQFVFHAHPKRGYVDMMADEAHFTLEMIDPNDFPNFTREGSNIVYRNRKAKIAQVLYDTTHMDERRSRLCREILARMKKLKS